MSVVYLILAHNSSQYVNDLLGYVHTPEDHFILHADQKSSGQLKTQFKRLGESFSNIHPLESRLCSWGGFSLVEVTLDAIDYALRMDASWSHFVLLSEQHFPLRSVEEIKAKLQPGVSYLDAVQVRTMYPAGKKDVYHRFGNVYRELPGVGSFPCDQRDKDDIDAMDIYHGSQWMVFARDACAVISESRSDTKFWDFFRSSLIADETAIQTLLTREAAAGRLNIVNQTMTFVAFPAVSQSRDMLFNEKNFLDARQAQKLFIRKRSPELLPIVAEILGPPQKVFPNVQDDEVEPDQQSKPLIFQTAELAASCIRDLLKPLFPEALIENLRPPVSCPRCYIKIRLKSWPGSMFISVVSEDMKNFKVALVLHGQMEGGFDPLEIAGFMTILIKPRVYDLFSAREFFFPDEIDHGFVAINSNAEIYRLVGFVAGRLIVAQELLQRLTSSGTTSSSGRAA